MHHVTRFKLEYSLFYFPVRPVSILTERLDGVLLRLFVLIGLPTGHQGGYGESICPGWELRFRGWRVLHVGEKAWTKILPFKWKKLNVSRNVQLRLFLAPSGGKKYVLEMLFAHNLLAQTEKYLALWKHLSLLSCQSCWMHVEGNRTTDSTDLCASCGVRSEAGCSLGSFSPIHPPLIIPVCPPITASASTSHSHCPTAALIPSSQLQNLELSGVFFMPKTPERVCSWRGIKCDVFMTSSILGWWQ